MSYAVAAALQAAVYSQLSGDTALGAIVGTAVYDAVPAGTLPAIYVTLGAETARDRSDMTGRGAAHDLRISVISDAQGFQQAKEAAAAVSGVCTKPGATALTRMPRGPISRAATWVSIDRPAFAAQ